jgi:hypothetical protein
MPPFEMQEAAELGKIKLGGCVIEDDAPTRSCRRCGTDWLPNRQGTPSP